MRMTPSLALEAVHLHQQLVEGLFPLVVAAAQTGAAVAPDGVNLVDEDDAGGVLLPLHEEVPDPGCAHAHEHLHEIGAGDGEERDIGFPGDGPGQKGLAGPRRAHQQHTLGDAAAQLGNFWGSLRNSMISWSSSLASSMPATSLKVTFFPCDEESFALLLPKDMALSPPDCIWRMKKIQTPTSSTMGSQERSVTR